MSNTSDKGTMFGDGAARVGMQLRSSPKVSTSSPLVSPSSIINVPRELYSIDVAATFGVPLTTVGDLQKLINDIDAGKHDELLSELTNEDRMETLEALGSICNSIKVDRNNADVIPCKVSYADDSINLNVDESTIPSDPIVQSVDINKSTSYAGVAGGSAKDQPNVNSNFRTLVADPVFDGVNISIPRKVVEKVSTRFEHTLYGYFIGKRMAFPVVEYYARNNWAKHGLKRIMMNSKGFFFFKFDSRAGLEAVLEGGPWLIRKSPIILKKWSMDTRLLKEELTRIPIWVKLHDVPIQVFEEDGISLIATFIGKPVMLDSYTSSMCNDSWGRSSFARCLIESRMSNTSDKGTTFGDGAARVGMQLRSSPKVSTSSPLVSPSTIINVPRELYSIDVAATFGVPLTTVGDLQKLINDIDAGKHDELLSELTNEDRMETLEALGSICNSIKVDRNNADVIPCKVSYADDSINLNVDESTIPSDPIVQSVDINKSTSYAGVAGGSAKDQPNVNSNFHILVADPVFDGVNISIPRKVVEKAKHGLKRIMMNSKGFFFFKFDSRAGLEVVLEGGPWLIYKSPIILKKWSMDTRLLKEELSRIPIWVKLHDVPIQVNSKADLVDAVTIGIPYLSEDDFTKETIFLSMNGGRPDVIHTNDGFQMVGKKKKRKGKSKSTNGEEEEEYEEEVENVYDESANLIQNTKAGGSSSFTAATG
ncbi:zinc knuckle CX2CX4HX4C containing protein [Tanacetum coccineum]